MHIYIIMIINARYKYNIESKSRTFQKVPILCQRPRRQKDSQSSSLSLCIASETSVLRTWRSLKQHVKDVKVWSLRRRFVFFPFAASSQLGNPAGSTVPALAKKKEKHGRVAWATTQVTDIIRNWSFLCFTWQNRCKRGPSNQQPRGIRTIGITVPSQPRHLHNSHVTPQLSQSLRNFA